MIRQREAVFQSVALRLLSLILNTHCIFHGFSHAIGTARSMVMLVHQSGQHFGWIKIKFLVPME